MGSIVLLVALQELAILALLRPSSALRRRAKPQGETGAPKRRRTQTTIKERSGGCSGEGREIAHLMVKSGW